MCVCVCMRVFDSPHEGVAGHSLASGISLSSHPLDSEQVTAPGVPDLPFLIPHAFEHPVGSAAFQVPSHEITSTHD